MSRALSAADLNFIRQLLRALRQAQREIGRSPIELQAGAPVGASVTAGLLWNYGASLLNTLNYPAPSVHAFGV
jgi:hypothetical protein